MSCKIGIVGAGHIVEDAHLPVLKAMSDVEVCWICDHSQERALLMAKMYGLRVISSQNITEALSEVDVCLLAIPLGVRQPYIEACARAGTALYVEKPFARTRQEHEANCAAFPPYGIVVGFQRRFYEPVAAIQDVIESGLFGPLRRIECNLGQYSLKSGGAKSYVADPILSGGGMVIESGIHALDQILFSTGAQSVNTTQVQAVAFDGIDYETVIHAELTVGEGQEPIAVECCMTRLRNLQQGFVYVFDSATLRFGMAPNAPIVVSAARGATDQEARAYHLQPDLLHPNWQGNRAATVHQAFYLFWRAFLQGVRDQQANHTAARSSLLTTQWVEEVYGRIFHV